MIIYQSWKFYENRPNRFREMLCTKSVRKIKKREKETIQLDTISLRATSRSSVWLAPKIPNYISTEITLSRLALRPLGLFFEINQKILISTKIRLSRRALRPKGIFFFNQSIEFNNVNSFCSICLYKMFTSEKQLISTEIRLSRRAFRPVCLFYEINW